MEEEKNVSKEKKKKEEEVDRQGPSEKKNDDDSMPAFSPLFLFKTNLVLYLLNLLHGRHLELASRGREREKAR